MHTLVPREKRAGRTPAPASGRREAPRAAHGSAAGSILSLQRAVGNRAVQRLPQNRVQRLGDTGQLPPGLACPVAHDNRGAGDENVFFGSNRSDLDAGAAAAIDNVVRNWHAAGAGERVRLDGYASVEGPDPLNWSLSCSRVMAVRSALMTPPGGGPGIPASFIDTFVHGETSEFGATYPPNRRVAIHLQGAPPTPPQTPVPAQPRVAPCATPRDIFSRGACGTGADFTFNDFPPLTGVDSMGQALVWQADNLSTDLRLRNDMRVELGLLAGSEGLRMVSHFSGGTGTRLTHGAGSPLGRDALSSGTFLRLHRSVAREIRRQLATMAAAGVIDCGTITLPPTAVPGVSFTFSDGHALKGIIGGTQGITIRITRFAVNPGSRTYDIVLQYAICDDFGVDTSDLYSPGLAAFWVLQHRRAGYVPFINELDLPVTTSGSY